MSKKIRLKQLEIPDELKKDVPVFYQFIYYNRLEPGDPFAYTEFSQRTQSLVFFSRPQKPVSKIVDHHMLS